MTGHLEPLFAELAETGNSAWVDLLRDSNRRLLAPAANGHMVRWLDTLEQLPDLPVTHTNFNATAVTFDGACDAEARSLIAECLRVFHPWRKGPFELFGNYVDAEWRSDLKWQRVAPHIDLHGKSVLDVGCGNGYYGWRMLGAGARCVVGLEPYPLYNMQHEIFCRYAGDARNHVVAANDAALNRPDGWQQPCFDVAMSMGVFYHAKNPIGHLESLRRPLLSGGQLVLETLVVEGDVDTALVPADRYAKMRNVWLIPSTLMLERMLTRCGFRDVQLVDVTRTTSKEQRRTDWMTFESLADFLDPNDECKTAEGHPSPQRAILVASAP